MTEQTKDQEKLEREIKHLGEAFSKALEQVGGVKVARSLVEKVAQATIENAKTYNAAEEYVKARCIQVDAQDLSKIYWKG